jgi:DNA-binding IclR family transcriptional regulator
MRTRQNTLVAEPDMEREDDPRFVVALARGLSILKAFKRGDAGLSNQQLAARTGLAKATISRLTYTLTRLGYLDYSTITGRYSLSVSALALGFTALGGIAVRDIARPLMQTMADRVGCSVAIGVPDKRTMVYIEHCRGQSPLHIGIEVGSHIRMATSAMGRAYLASLDQATRETLLDELCPPDGNGAAMREGVQAAVEQYQRYGYVTSVGEWKQEINSVGVPLTFHGSQPYALNCGGSALLLKIEMLDSVGRELVDLAVRIRRSLENSA